MQCVVRFICELITVCGAVIYLISAGYEATLQGLKTFGESLQVCKTCATVHIGKLKVWSFVETCPSNLYSSV